ncbi:hypothetical protein Tco_0924024 [Tanacetum coccineum]|uniref:Uncharacterized protein n=1 Tax=Tanacetum coccineum TaxID=301880 RepID=A0ABQ5D2N2_9ASTR
MFRVNRVEDRVTMHGVQVQLVIGEHRTELGMLIQVKKGRLCAITAMENGVVLDEEQLLFIASGQDNAIDEDVDEKPVQDLTLNVDNVFQADDCDAFDSDVDEAHMAETMFMANLSFADPVYDEAVKIAPPDFSKENYFAIFIPQKQLTPEQIFWSQDLIKIKEKALKEQTTALRPIKALTVYESIFEELEAEVDQNIVNRKHDEIERKNLLIANDNLIADCLSKDVFYIATNSELTVSRFTECMKPPPLTLDFQITQLTKKVSVLHEQNELFMAENEKVKQHYKELYDSIKITCAKYAIDVEPIPPHNRNNREVHLDYLKHLKESVETLREIVKEAKVERPFDRSLESAYLYTKHSLELLEYAISTCLKVEITVVILVRDRCPRGKGNLPRLPIRTNIVRLATPSIGSYEHYKGVVAEVEHSKPGFELQGAKMIEEDSDELEYPQELFSAVDLLSLQFLGAFCTQRKVSMVSFGRISPNRFLSSILLVVVIIVTVVIVVVILVVVIFMIVEVVIVVVFPVFTAGVPVRLLALAMAAVCASRAAVKSAVSCDNSSSRNKEYSRINCNDGGNIGDRVKIAGGVIGSGDEIGICFLKLFNDPRIIRDKRIAAYNGYRGGGVVQVLKGTSKGGVQAKNLDVGVYRSRLKCWICLSAAAAVWSKKKHMWPSILTMKRFHGPDLNLLCMQDPPGHVTVTRDLIVDFTGANPFHTKDEFPVYPLVGSIKILKGFPCLPIPTAVPGG